jgi:hypothetical protein
MTLVHAFMAWRRERLGVLPFFGVAMVVAAGARDVTVSVTATALVWITAFRLWDDIRSRDDDANKHPGRAVVRGPLAPFSRAAAVAVIVGAVVALAMGVLWGFVGIVVALAGVYTVPMPRSVRETLVLLKYPAMATALSSSTHPPTVWHLLVLFVCFLVDDRLTGEAPMPARALPFLMTFFVLLCVL